MTGFPLHPRVGRGPRVANPRNGAALALREAQAVTAPPSPGPHLYPTSPEGWGGGLVRDVASKAARSDVHDDRFEQWVAHGFSLHAIAKKEKKSPSTVAQSLRTVLARRTGPKRLKGKEVPPFQELKDRLVAEAMNALFAVGLFDEHPMIAAEGKVAQKMIT